MKSRTQRLIEVIELDIKEHVYIGEEEELLKQFIEYLQTDILPHDWQDNEYITRSIDDLHSVCIEFGV